MRFDSKVSRESNLTKTELNSLSVSQQIPVGSFFSSRRLKKSMNQEGEFKKRADLLQLNHHIEQLFLEVQYKKMILSLAKEKIALMKSLGREKNRKVVYVSTNLDIKRLNIIKNDVSLDFDRALVDFRSSVLQLKSALSIPLEVKISFDTLKTPSMNFTLEESLKRVKAHPYVHYLNYSAQSARLYSDHIYKKMVGDPTLTVFRDRDYLADRAQTNVGAELSVSLPLWGARKDETLEKDLAAKLLKRKKEFLEISYMGKVKQLFLSMEQQFKNEKEYRLTILKSAKSLLDKRIVDYKRGRSNLLNLIDAYQSYFEYEKKYFDILYVLNQDYDSLQYYRAELN